jgi:hypothetical protein
VVGVISRFRQDSIFFERPVPARFEPELHFRYIGEPTTLLHLSKKKPQLFYMFRRKKETILRAIYLLVRIVRGYGMRLLCRSVRPSLQAATWPFNNNTSGWKI